MSEPTGNASGVSFGSYGKSFQEKIVQALLTDHRWAEQMLEVFDSSYLELKYLSFLADRYFTYAKKYKVFPTMQLLVTIIKDELKSNTDGTLRDQVVDYLQRVRANPSPGDMPYVKEKALDFCRKQALKAALEDAVDQIQAEKYESIVDGIKRAVSVGTVTSLGHNFFTDYESRLISLKRECIPTGIDELDQKDILNGGLGKGELGVIVAPTGVGKSHFLVMLGCNAMRAHKNVLHFTFELSETMVGVRYDSNLCDVDSNTIVENKDKIVESYSHSSFGQLYIKSYPTNTATIHTLRAHVERLALRGFVPDIILVDYADIMRSTRQYDSLRHELKLVYEELRGFSMERNLPIWTASQSNKEGSNSDVVDLGNMSEAYGKAMVADVVVSVSRKAYEKATGWGRLFVAKNRAGRDGVLYPVKIDTARSKFAVTGQAHTPEDAHAEDADEFKKALRSKWNELQTGVAKIKTADTDPPPSSRGSKDDDEETE
jgi:replicative DNA helicase